MASCCCTNPATDKIAVSCLKRCDLPKHKCLDKEDLGPGHIPSYMGWLYTARDSPEHQLRCGWRPGHISCPVLRRIEENGCASCARCLPCPPCPKLPRCSRPCFPSPRCPRPCPPLPRCSRPCRPSPYRPPFCRPSIYRPPFCRPAPCRPVPCRPAPCRPVPCLPGPKYCVIPYPRVRPSRTLLCPSKLKCSPSKPRCSLPCPKPSCFPPKCATKCYPASCLPSSCCNPCENPCNKPMVRIIRHNGQYSIVTKPDDITNHPSGPYPLKYVIDTDNFSADKNAKFSIEAKFNDQHFDYTSSQSSFVLDFCPPDEKCYKPCPRKSTVCYPCQNDDGKPLCGQCAAK